jgi:GT2 family glycosyltransferase
MKLTVAIPVMNQIEETKGMWGCHIANIEDKENTEILVIDNGSTDGTEFFLERFVFPYFPDHRIIHNSENVGVLASMNQCYKESKGDVIAILHNDVYVFDRGWDKDVLAEFEKDPKLGLAGFLGADGVGPTGGRQGTLSNMLEAEIHGTRFTGVKPVMIFDGLSLICRRAMLDQVGGFDEGYTYHHFYDRDISLASYFAGWTNKVIGVSCHHRSGLTANRPDYQTWIDKKMETNNFTGDKTSYDASERYFLQKWGSRLPKWSP